MDIYRSGHINRHGNHVLVGMDADLVILAMLSPLSNIIIARLDCRDQASAPKPSPKKPRPPERQLYLEVELKRYLLEFNPSPTVYGDFVIMSALLGNDFVPALTCCENKKVSLDRILEVYRNNNIRILDDDYHVTLSEIQRLIAGFSDCEVELLKNIVENPRRYTALLLLECTNAGNFYSETFRERHYIRELVPRSSNPALTDLLHNMVPETTWLVQDDEIRLMCTKYLTTLVWIYYYYSGTNPNSEWYYPYHAAPLLYDILHHDCLPNLLSVTQQYSGLHWTPLEQLVAVLPLESRNLPLEVQSLMNDSCIHDCYVSDFTKRMDGSTYDYKAKADIPLIDKARICSAVLSLGLDPRTTKQWESKENELLVLNARRRERDQDIGNTMRGRGHGRGRASGNTP